MRNVSISLLILSLLLVSLSGVLHAQSGREEVCIVTLIGQNGNRTVAGAVNKACGAGSHSAPWGNWGVSSNYGRNQDTDQFRGWKWKDGPSTKKQWNSCTTKKEQFRAPSYRYYNASNYTTQASSGVVIHGERHYRFAPRLCRQYSEEPTPGCRGASRKTFSQSDNYMTVYELDWPDSDDLIETLNFPGTSITFGTCTQNGCPEKTSGWRSMSSSTSREADLRAQLRMKGKARLESSCDWDWN